MKKYFFGFILGLFFILSYKMDSFADGVNVFYVYGEAGAVADPSTNRYSFNASSLDSSVRFCAFGNNLDPNTNTYNISRVYCNQQVSVPYTLFQYYTTKENGITVPHNVQVPGTANFTGVSIGNANSRVYQFYPPQSLSFNTSASIPFYTDTNACAEYLRTGDMETQFGNPINQNDLPFNSTSASSNIPTPVVNWVLNDDGSLSRTLQFTNAQLPQNPNIRMGLQLIVHWASVDNITLSYSNQSASMLGTGYSVFYDNALSQEGTSMGYGLPSNSSGMRACPDSIDFITNSDSISLFNSFLLSHPVSERTINYSPSGISSFAESFRSHLGNIDFAYNVPYVSCRYYYTTSDGNSLIYGGWTNTYPKLPSQGAVLSINKQTGEIYVPSNDGTFNEGTDIDGNPIFDNGTTINGPDLVNFDDLNNSVHNMFSYLGEFPSFLAYLFPFLPSWIPILLASVIGTLIVVGVVRIILK